MAQGFPIALVDENGKYLGLVSADNPLPQVEVNDYHALVNDNFHKHTGTSTTLAVATSDAGTDYQITVADATDFLAGSLLKINGTNEISHPVIVGAPAGNLITLDRRIDKLHAIGTTVEIIESDLSAAAGTIAVPIEYIVEPATDEIFEIYRLIVSMSHSTAGDLGLFGNKSALTNGVLIRALIGGIYSTFTNWKINSDIKNDMFDVVFDTRSGGGGTYGTSGRGTFKNVGVTIKLNGSNGDRLELYVQDDLTSLASFRVKAQGRRVAI